MERKDNISDYRSKLDNTLASPDLTNDETIKTLVKNQILQSSHFQFEEYLENVVERKSKEVSGFLEMLRSATKSSGKESHRAWKVKEDTQEFRVMYREGPEGTPFHSLLVEGYVDGPLDVCLCISWESGLYQKWWPQVAIPTFKVVSSQCLQRVRTGENISLVRMKVPWPLSSREALIHYFAFEYLQDGLIVVLLNSISDSETIDIRTHGFTRDGIPNSQDVVRIDVVGGFAIQKVTADRSFFRTIANMDIKLDFVPPALINFISRQLVGSGFKLYKKEVSSVSEGDEKFIEALKEPLYFRTREALFSGNTSLGSLEQENQKKSTSIELEQGTEEPDHSASNNGRDDNVITSENIVGIIGQETCDEIEEFEENDTEGSKSLQKITQKLCDDSSGENSERADKEIFTVQEVEQILRTTHEIAENLKTKKVVVSPEVEQALETMEKIISVYRETNGNRGIFHPKIYTENLVNLKICDMEESMSLEADLVCRKSKNRESLGTGSTKTTSQEHGNSSEDHGSRHEESAPHSKETNQSHDAPASEVESGSHKALSVNKTNGHVKPKTENKKSRYCCFHFISGN